MKDSIVSGLVAVACVVGIVVGIIYISDKVRCIDAWPFSTVCAIKH